jgi:AraC family transcriptional activator of pobA
MKRDLHHPIDAFGILKVSMSGIRIERLEERKVPKVPFPHKHDFFQIILIAQGSGRHQIDFQDYPVTKRQIFIIKPGQVHSWQLQKNVQGFVIEFNRESLPDFNEQLTYSADEFILKDKNFETMVQIIKIMEAEFIARKELYDVCLRNYLAGFLIQLYREDLTDRNKSLKLTNLIDQFRLLVEENYKTEHRVEFYAQKLKVTPKALTMQITRSLGKSPRDLIQDRFLLESKRLLAFSHLGVSEIGYELGFDDANYFTRLFKKHVKQTPAQFRKKYKH